jgi:hypothetical protein
MSYEEDFRKWTVRSTFSICVPSEYMNMIYKAIQEQENSDAIETDKLLDIIRYDKHKIRYPSDMAGSHPGCDIWIDEVESIDLNTLQQIRDIQNGNNNAIWYSGNCGITLEDTLPWFMKNKDDNNTYTNNKYDRLINIESCIEEYNKCRFGNFK